MDFILQNWAWIVGLSVFLFLIWRFGVYEAIMLYKEDDKNNAFAKAKRVILVVLDSMLALTSNIELEKKEKMDKVVDDLYNLVPEKYSKFANKKVLRFFCQSIYDRFKGKIEMKSKHNELLKIVASEVAGDIAKKAVEDYAENLMKTDFDGRIDIVGNQTVQDFAVKAKKDIQLKLKAEAEAIFNDKLKGRGLLGLELIKKI